MAVYHVLNPHSRPTWRELLQWLHKIDEFEVVSPGEWVRKLEGVEGSDHSAMKLLGLWRDTYGKETQASAPRPKFSTAKTEQHILALRNVQPLDEVYMRRIWSWVQENVR